MEKQINSVLKQIIGELKGKSNQKPSNKNVDIADKDDDVAGNTENASNKKCRHTRKGRFSPTLCEIINGVCKIINGVCEIINGGFTIANVNNLNKKNSMKLKIEEKSSLFWIMFIGIWGFVILFICGY